jgi:hypothetical protein
MSHVSLHELVCLVGIALAACSGAAPKPALAARPSPPRSLCDGLDDEACQARALAQSFCLVAPERPACAELRAAGWLPPLAPPLVDLLHCWRVREVRDDLPESWWCLGEHDIAVFGHDRWDVWNHRGWKREDRPSHASWTTEVVGGPALWLTVLADEPVLLHVSDGGGRIGATLEHDARAGERASRRRALPTIDEVCDAARACLAALRPPSPRPSPGAASESIAESDPLAGVSTLAACHDAWAAASARLGETALPVPPSCGVASATDARIVSPPFAPLTGSGTTRTTL